MRLSVSISYPVLEQTRGRGADIPESVMSQAQGSNLILDPGANCHSK